MSVFSTQAQSVGHTYDMSSGQLDMGVMNEKGDTRDALNSSTGNAEERHTIDVVTDEIQYPTGWRLFAIAIAIVLSMFLVRLYYLCFSTVLEVVD